MIPIRIDDADRPASPVASAFPRPASIRAFLQNSSDAIEVIAPDGAISFSNEAAARRQAAAGCRAGSEGWIGTWPDECGPALRAAMNASRGGRSERLQVRTPANPTDRWWEVVVSAVEEGNAFLGWLAIAREISEEKDAEFRLADSQRQLATLVDKLPGVAYRCGIDVPWLMHYISSGAEALTGWSAEAFMAGELGWMDIIHPADRRAVSDAVDRAVHAQGSFSATYRVITKSGEHRWVSESGQYVPATERGEAALEGFIGDITEYKRADFALKEREEQYRYTVELNPQISWVAEPDGRIVSFGSRWVRGSYTSGSRLIGKSWLDAVHPEDFPSVRDAWLDCVVTGKRLDIEYRFRLKNGAYEWHRARSAPRRDARGNIVRWYGTVENVHARVSAEQRLKKSEEMLRAAQEAGRIGSFTLDYRSGLATCSPTMLALYGLPPVPNIVSLDRWIELLHPDDRERRLEESRRALTGETYLESEFRIVRVDGEVRWMRTRVAIDYDEEGSPRTASGIQQDITGEKESEAQLQASEARARRLAERDALTGLANRNLFQRTLDALVEGRRDAPFALLLLDVDEFKQINDTLGHDAGDAMLCAFAERLQRIVRTGDTIARLGGDEFALLIGGVADAAELDAFAVRLFDVLREPLFHQHKLLDCRASVGAAVFPNHAFTASDLLKRSDLALYAAKKAGRGIMRTYEDAMEEELHRRRAMLALGRRVLDEGLVLPFYQPKVDLRSGKVAGYEALLRWIDPVSGVQPPSTIAACFEDMTLAAAISERMIDSVLADMRIWLRSGVDFGHVAINASAAEFRNGAFAQRLLERLDRAGIGPERLQIEVTETVFLGRGAGHVESALWTLADAGIRVALDDFGTGYASLSNLKKFPVHALKIDRSFVRDLQIDPEDGAIVDAVIGLGRSLNLEVIAEGIETRAQRDFVSALGCTTGQGYLYGRAVPASEVARASADAAGLQSAA
jgi:diguanylate cyclase (GGDEF)-like protein/PAS domain S-box-containing protein